MSSEENSGEPHGKRVHSFQESAKKFKPGPVAPLDEPEASDMSGAEVPGAVAGVAMRRAEQQAAGMSEQLTAGMLDGAPGRLQKMPGE